MHNYTWENTNMAGDWGRHLTILSSPSSHLSVTSKSLVWFPKAWSVFCFWVPLPHHLKPFLENMEHVAPFLRIHSQQIETIGGTGQTSRSPFPPFLSPFLLPCLSSFPPFFFLFFG